MSHYKSNVRDQVFNLFEVFGVDKVLGEGAYSDLDVDTAREMLAEITRLAEGPIAESFADGDRNPPVFDPETHTVKLPEAFKKSVRTIIDGGWDKIGLDEELGGMPMPRALQWALMEHVLGANPAVYMYSMGAGFANIFYNQATEEQKKWAVLAVRARLDLHHGAHRARRRIRRRRGPHQGRPAGGRHLAHRRREALHHLRRRRRHRREHPAPGAGPPRGRRTRHQGAVAVLRAEVPLRPRDRRARRAQRRLRHQRRAQDGPQGLRDLRAVPRPARRARQGLAGRRGPQRHRADVRRHRAGPNDGGHQGNRHPVDRLPQRARVRQDPHPGCRPDPDDGQDRAPRHASRTTRTCVAAC